MTGDEGGDPGDNGTATDERNVHGDPLRPCSTDPMTGALRDGSCHALRRDPGRHEVCAVMTDEFLEYRRAQATTSSPRGRR